MMTSIIARVSPRTVEPPRDSSEPFPLQHGLRSRAQRLSAFRREREAEEAQRHRQGNAPPQGRRPGQLAVLAEPFGVAEHALGLAPAEKARARIRRVVRLGEGLLKIAAIAVDSAMHRLDRRAVGEAPERPWPLADRIAIGN